jgi:hypothetical protein
MIPIKTDTLVYIAIIAALTAGALTLINFSYH